MTRSLLLSILLLHSAQAQEPSTRDIPRTSFDAAVHHLLWTHQPLQELEPEDSAEIHKALYYQGGYLLIYFQSKPANPYLYEKIPIEVWNAWQSSTSKGRFYSQWIKGVHHYRFRLR